MQSSKHCWSECSHLIEYSNNIKEEMKVTQSDIKKNIQGTNSEGKEAEIQISDLEWKE